MTGKKALTAWFWLSFAAAFCLPAYSAEDPFRSISYDEVLRCGPNSLFMFFILSGKNDIRLSDFSDTSASPAGASLLDLKVAAGRFGLQTEIRHYDTDKISAIRLPAIGQFKTSDSSLTPYHFDVLYKVDSEKAYLINGTTGGRFAVYLARMPSFWTGNILVKRQALAEKALYIFSSNVESPPFYAEMVAGISAVMLGAYCVLLLRDRPT